jgi:hypothetical protein
MSTKPDDILGMSDDDILNMQAPPEAPAQPDPDPATVPDPTDTPADLDPAAAPAADAPADKPAGEADPEADPAAVDEPQLVPVPGSEAAAPKADEKKDEPKPGEADPAKTGAEAEPKPGEPAADATSSAGEKRQTGAELPPEQLVQFYDQIMTPFKANGKTVELRSPEEAIKLMQMGANYTKKLQDLQPHRKVLLMLENNGLLDEGKLSFLIDVDKKDPEAIKKLLKDTGIDPLEIDTSTDPAYLEGNHRISDEEVSFRTTLDELGSTPEGAKTLTEINTDWDQASKEVLWQSPEIMTVIHEQRETGIYDLIKAEVDRKKTLGEIPPNTPFLQAYKTVGDAMAAQALGTTGGSDGKQPEAETGQAEPQVLATRAAAPKKQVENGDRASAASPTRAAAPTKATVVNPLAESDEAFLKRMENRV